MLVLVDANPNLKIESFDRKTVQKIRENWNALSKAFSSMVDVLVNIGFSGGFLSSYNATMPIVYYLYKGGKIKTDNDLNEVRKFLSVSMGKRLFGVASNDSLKKTRETLQSHDCSKDLFNSQMFESVVLTGNRTFVVGEADIDYWLDNYTIGQSTYAILALLYPSLKLSQISFHQDHCHPFAGFDKGNLKQLGLSDEKIVDWQYKRNLLPNLQFLEGSANESKNKKPLKDWIAAGNTIEYMPKNTSLELIDFDDFFAKRRQLIKEDLMRIFNVSS